MGLVCELVLFYYPLDWSVYSHMLSNVASSCATTTTPHGVTVQTITHSASGESCGCKCVEASRAYCGAQNCSCTQGVGGGQSSTHSPKNFDCGCGCKETQRAYCSSGNCIPDS